MKNNYGRFRNIINALVKNKMALTYTWILQYLIKANNNIVLKVF